MVLSNFSTSEVGNFIFHLFYEEELKKQDDYLFQVWLHKVWDAVDFEDWKKSILKANLKVEKKMTDEEADRNIRKANKILGIKEVKK